MLLLLLERCTQDDQLKVLENLLLTERHLSQKADRHVILQANQQLGGKWRLPTLAELESIVCLECPAPKIDAEVFPNTASEPYWTSEANWIAPRSRWSVSFMTGLKYGRFFPQQQLAGRLVSDR